MARSRTIEAEHQARIAIDSPDDAGFGAEFRELARQRRFVRGGERPSIEAEFWGSAPAAAAAPVAPTPAPAAAPMPDPVVTTPASTPAAPRVRPPRISEDQRATLLELARMSDRLVQSREDLAAATTRAAHLEAELAAANGTLAAANDRLMAARVLVQDAQRTTRELAERAAWLEGRVEVLQEALELAVNASVVTRWKWRREQRARARA